MGRRWKWIAFGALCYGIGMLLGIVDIYHHPIEFIIILVLGIIALILTYVVITTEPQAR